jgi:hypothetical protein
MNTNNENLTTLANQCNLPAWEKFFRFKFRKADLGGRKINVPKLVSWWVVTVWLSLFVALAGHAQTSTSTNAGGTTLVQQANANQTLNSPAQSSAQPQVVYCNAIAWLVATIIILGIVLYILIAICYAAGICGNNGNPPPQAPPNNGNNGNVVFKPNVTISSAISTNLPVTIFYLVNGQVVSNSAGFASSMLPPLLSLGGSPVPNGSQISSSTPGISTPPSIGVWIETNTYSDAVLDPTHNYAAVLNYSVLISTNLPDWKEAYTVISWVNNNPTVPLVASIYYTNGVPETTNWSQLYLNQFKQPTNIVVYGTLPTVATNQLPFRPADLTPPGATNIVNGNMSIQLYTLTCNTNAVVTQWP